MAAVMTSLSPDFFVRMLHKILTDTYIYIHADIGILLFYVNHNFFYNFYDSDCTRCA